MGSACFVLQLRGSFRLVDADNVRIDVPGKKAQALIAMLATAPGGERMRSWLQGQLWGSRGQEQAQASLRSELLRLRAVLNTSGSTLLHADQQRIWLDLDLIELADGEGDFLEGLDIPGEDGFEDWLRAQRGRFVAASPASISPVVSDFADRPALAVLPFVNASSDVSLDYLAEGISEDLIDRLSRLRWLPIIARSSSFAVRDSDPDPKSVGATLGARYLLEGRVQTIAGETILAASLVDCESGNILWSNRMPLARGGAPDALPDLLAGLTSALGTRIDVEEQSRALRKAQSDLNVRDLIWRGRWHLNRFTQDDATAAKACFAEALVREPTSPEALIQMTWAHLWDLWAKRGTNAEIRAVRQMAQQAIMTDFDDARGHMLAGIAEIWLRQPARAEALLRQALALNPSLALAQAQLGSTLYLRGDPAEAIKLLMFGIRLSPNDYALFYTQGELAMAHLMLGEHAAATGFAEKAVMNRSAYWYGHVVKVNALVRSGDTAGARAALDDLHISNPQFKDSHIDWLPFIDSEWNDFLKAGLNLARGSYD